MKIGNIEVSRDEHGQILVRKHGTPRQWPWPYVTESNVVAIEPSELADLRVALDAIEERGGMPPAVLASEIVAVIADGGHALARDVYARSMRRAIVNVEVHAETFAYVERHCAGTKSHGWAFPERHRVVLGENVVVVRTRSRTGEPIAELPHNEPQTDAIVQRAIVEGALALRDDIAARTGTHPPLIDINVDPHLYHRLVGGVARGWFNPCVGVEISVMQDPSNARNGGRSMR